MTIVKHETVELTREERNRIKKCINLLRSAMNGASDPILKDEARTIALALENFRDNFTTLAYVEDEEETISDYDRGFQDGMKWEHDNPPVRPNY